MGEIPERGIHHSNENTEGILIGEWIVGVVVQLLKRLCGAGDTGANRIAGPATNTARWWTMDIRYRNNQRDTPHRLPEENNAQTASHTGMRYGNR